MGERVVQIKAIGTEIVRPDPMPETLPDAPPAKPPQQPGVSTLGLTTLAVLLLSAPAYADGAYMCYQESPWWKGLYDTVIYGQDAGDRGAAVEELSRWGCHPTDKDGDGDLDPNPDCNPPPDCSFGNGTLPPIPPKGGAKDGVSTSGRLLGRPPSLFGVSGRTWIVPQTRAVQPYVPPVYAPDDNQLGDFFCTCARTQMAVGEEIACYVQGATDGPISWSTTGPIQSDDVQDDRSISIMAMAQGTGTVIMGERVCASVYVHPLAPSFQEQALALATEAASRQATERERERTPPWWKTGTGVTAVLLGIGGTLAAIMAARGGSSQSAGPAVVVNP